MKIVTVQQMRAIEADAEQHYGLPGTVLMEHAGASAATLAIDWLGGDITDTTWLILVGPGNNGGDGRVMGKHLSDAGANVIYFDWKQQRLDDGKLTISTQTQQPLAIEELLTRVDIVVDALLGIGHSRPLTSEMVAINDIIRREQRRRKGELQIIALDTPSGVNCDTGEVDPGTLAADLTITLATPKGGLLWFPAAEYIGELRTGSIGLPPEMHLPGIAELIQPNMIAELLPKRTLNSHKGTFGKVLIVAGSSSFPGAALLAALAALRAGAGLVTIATTRELMPIYASALPEATYLLLSDNPQDRVHAIINAAQHADALLMGPGLGQEPMTHIWYFAILQQLKELADATRPHLVIDADGLNLLSSQPQWHHLLPPNSILTPHPIEMSRLMNGKPVSSGGQDRLPLVSAMAQTWGHTVVLKGAVTLIAGPAGTRNTLPWVNFAPNPALATGGTGDVLAGTITSLLGQGIEPFYAAATGVAVHSLAGKLAAEALGNIQAGILASEIAHLIPQARALIIEQGVL